MSETENVSKKRWYVLQAFSGFESRVAITLREYIKQQQMEDQFGEVLVPSEEVGTNTSKANVNSSLAMYWLKWQ